MFGLQWQAMIQGLAFMSHQLGSFLGAYGGGLLYDSLGSYTMAWRIGVAWAGGRHYPGGVCADTADGSRRY
jgi:predicted MFS family arabinose efflux permease